MDIGGANTKAAWQDGTSLRTASRPFEIWRDPHALAAVLREVAAAVASGPAPVAITMTAELSDAFRTKREGVAFVLDAAEDALGDRPLSVLTTAGELVSTATARARPRDVAAANWVATALAVAAAHPDALLVDIGSTTTDIVPIAAGRVAAAGHNDLETERTLPALLAAERERPADQGSEPVAEAGQEHEVDAEPGGPPDLP